MQAAHIDSTCQQTIHLTGGVLCLVLFNDALQLLDFIQIGLDLSGQLIGSDLQSGCGFCQNSLGIFHLLEAQFAGDGFDSADAGGNAAFADQLKRTDLGGVIQMGTAAELNGVAAHVDNADGIAVLLAEECSGSQLSGFLDGHFFRHDVVALQNGVLNDLIDLGKLFGGQSRVMGEVKAQVIGLHQRACLMDMVAQDGGQRLLQQVGGRVGTHNGLAAT